LFKRRKKTEQRSVVMPGDYPLALDMPPDGARPVTPDMALRVADVYACIRCLADAAASLPLIAYRPTADGRTRAGGRIQDLIDRPAPATTTSNLVGQLLSHLLIHGNSYVAKLRGQDGRVEQLMLLDPRRVTVEIVGSEPRYTIHPAGGGEETLHGISDILHVKALSTDGIYGMSPIRQCAVALRVARGAGDFMDAYLAHGGRPSGVLSLGGNTTPEAFARLTANLDVRHSGVRNMHRIAVVEGADVNWTSMVPTLGDLEFVEHRKLSTQEICRIFRIPPRVVGAATADPQTYANVESVQVEFVTHSLRPWLVTIEQAVTNDADLCRGGLYVEFLIDSLLRSDSKTRAEVYTLALGDNVHPGWMTRAEIRKLENLDPEPPSTNGVVPAQKVVTIK
jgi:HK97 family phage portal protein